VEFDQVAEWRSKIVAADKDFKAATKEMNTEYWLENRRLTPRTSPLGEDVLGNKYWVFSSRQTKTRDFGGWVVIQTPNGLPPHGKPVNTNNIFDTNPSPISPMKSKTTIVPANSDVENDDKDDLVEDKPSEEDAYQALKSWYYVMHSDDIRLLINWVTYLSTKKKYDMEAAELREKRASEKAAAAAAGKGSPNKLGQHFAVEVAPTTAAGRKRAPRGHRVGDAEGAAETRALCDELLKAQVWIEERYVFPCCEWR